MAAPKKYPDELRERAVRLYRESDPKPVIRRLAEQLGVHHEALRNWIRQAEADHGERHDRPTTAESEELRRLRKENTELRRANEILKAASLDSTGQRNTPQVVDHDRGGRWHAWAGRGCPMRTALICGSAGGAGSRSVTSLGRSSGPRVQCSRCSSRAGAMFRRHAGADRGR
ncbi:hypothetical protein Pdca_39160 [Pseudonocardia autotrophica]|uniref:transposase n=2 Tax=Pseudonocardiaceae TaxID=2070 RepID=UPI000E335E38|nr:transposase [Pseudonocardia autotrophica]BBG02707.1 hypothetical protein Pdca_39160 [Pseudonocardia autotrophica]